MSDIVTIHALVEGETERLFVRELVAPHLQNRGIYMIPTFAGKQSGDVRFARFIKDIRLFLRQREDSYVTVMVDFFRIGHDWPGRDEAFNERTAAEKAEILNRATAAEVAARVDRVNTQRRFIPYVSMHEIEALLFSDARILSEALDVDENRIRAILDECGKPEEINDSPATAPSKRLESLAASFKKKTTGITVAKAIGLGPMREACPRFDEWLTRLEGLAPC